MSRLERRSDGLEQEMELTEGGPSLAEHLRVALEDARPRRRLGLPAAAIPDTLEGVLADRLRRVRERAEGLRQAIRAESDPPRGL
jgi:hypothetical protein